MMFKSFKDRVALVTGASRGIGHAIALKLGEAGATVIGTATSKEGAEQLTHAFKAANMVGEGMVVNVAHPDSIDRLFESIKARYVSPAIVVNNAAVTHDNLLLRMKEEEWSAVIETDLTSIYRITKAVLRDMVRSRWGRIINISSVVGTIGNAGQANYAAAKAGLIGFSKALAQEVGSRNITINVIAPGFIDTDMTRKLNQEQREHLLQRIPLQRLGLPEDIAAAVLFLASDAANYITGQTLHINGGMLMV